MSDYGKILMSTANAVGASLKKKMGSLTGYAPVDWAETINKLGNKLPERTVSGAVCSFADGADDVPMTSVKASITAVQAGSGDPSPSNVRAISGFTTLNFSNVGTVNICDNVFEQGSINVNTGTDSTGANYNRTKNYIAIKADQEYYCKSGYGVYAFFYDDSKNYLGYHGSNLQNKTFTPSLLTNASSNGKSFALASFVRFRYGNGTFNNDFCINYPSSDTTLHTTYAGETIPVWMGGKNLLDPDAISEIVINSNNDKRYGITVTKAGTYTLSCTSKPTNHYFYVKVKASDGTYGTGEMINATTPRTKTIVSGATLLVYNAGTGYTKAQQSALIIDSQTMLEAGQTATTYEPCRYIYGGELNLTTGVLTVTHERVDMGSLSWTKNASYSVFFCNLGGVNTEYNACCDIYLYAGTTTSAAGANGKGNYTLSILTNDDRHLIYIRDDDYSTADDFTEAVDGHYLVYELATPTTIQLTPEEVRSFLGTNNLWANTGDSEVTYFAQPNVPTEVLYKGQISTTSAYATANFSESVADDEEILVKVYCPARSAVDYKVIKVSDIGNGLNVGFNLHTTVNCTITKTSIASYQYSGDYYDIYADVLAYDSAIFN